MVSAEHPLAVGSRQVEGSSRDLRDLWRVSNPTMPPQASPVVDRACRVEKTHMFLSEPEPPNLPKVKCVLIGDGTIGKTSLIVSYTTNGYPTEYVPTAFDNYSVIVTVDDHPLRLQLCDTAGQDDFDSLRPLCYPNTDIFLLCFSVVSPTSFHNINDKWLAEIRQHCPKIPIVLVGTQCDLRNDVKVLIELAHYNDKPVSEQEARQKAHDLGALDYIECSALTQKNLKEVFDTAILAALENQGLLGKKLSKKSQKYKCSTGGFGGGNIIGGGVLIRTDGKVRKGSIKTLPASPVLQNKHRKDGKTKRGWKKFCCFS